MYAKIKTEWIQKEVDIFLSFEFKGHERMNYLGTSNFKPTESIEVVLSDLCPAQ